MLYFVHILTGDKIIPDEEGLELADLPAARAELRASAIDLAMAACQSGKGTQGQIVELRDATGTLIEHLLIRNVLH